MGDKWMKRMEQGWQSLLSVVKILLQSRFKHYVAYLFP